MKNENAANERDLKFEKFNKALHDRSAFSCGNVSIDNFFKHSLSRAIKMGMVAAWVATKGNDHEILGFYTLGASSISSRDGMKEWQRTSIPEIPVILIRPLGVRDDSHGMGIG